MEGRRRKYGGQISPERSKVWTEPPQKYQQQQGRKIPVVYYLCRNHHLEHPHFIEVPISSQEGLYLRDVINRLNVLRGKGMPAMYSWSCKRSYKNGFVWHDLSEDDLVLPAHGNEYVLKGSELLDESPSDRFHHSTSNTKLQSSNHPQQTQEGSSSSSPITIIKEAKPPPPSPPQEEELSPTPHRPGSSGNISPGSPSLVEYRVHKPNVAADASTQTEESGARRASGRDTQARGISTDDGSLDLEFYEDHGNRAMRLTEGSEIGKGEISPPPTSSSTSYSGRKMETLESLIRAEASKMNRFRILEQEEVLIPSGVKLKATNMLMQLITCGAISVKDHHSFGFIPTYKPRFSNLKFPSPMFTSSLMVRELDCLSENPRLTGLRMEEKEYFSGSLIETKKHKEEVREEVPNLKRSSSYNEDRSCKSPDSTRDKEKLVDSARSKCLPRSIRITPNKQSRSEMMKSPISDGSRNSSSGPDCSQSPFRGSSKGGSKRITDASSVKGSSMRLESFKEEKENLIKIEESLLRELG